MSFTLSTGNKAVPSASAAVNDSTASATITVSASCYLTDGWVQSTGVVARIYINGSLVATKTILGNGTSYSATAVKTVTATSAAISKGTASKSVAWYVEFWQYTDGTAQAKKETISGTKTIGAKPSYSVKYNANGGSGAPAAQTKWHGTALTLSSAKPTRTGHTFQGWGTSTGDTSVDYAAGANYTANAAITLYAIWKANTYTIKYDANGGSGAPANQTKTHGQTLTLSGTKPARTNYNFLGWSTSKTATTATYSAGGSFATNAATTLYAVWELAYTPPTVSRLTVGRCTEDGTEDDFGSYATVSFDWSVCQTMGANSGTSCVVKWKQVGVETFATGDTVTATLSGISGTAEIKFGGSFSTEYYFDVEIIVYDSLGGATSKAGVVTAAKFIMDLLWDGGASFGKPAELVNTVDFGWKTRHRNNAVFENDKNIAGLDADGNEINALIPVTASGNTSLGHGFYKAKKGNTHLYGHKVQFYTNEGVYLNGSILVLKNNTSLCGLATDGVQKRLIFLNGNDNIVIGYDNYADKTGNTNIYGHDITFGLSNIAEPGSFYPYFRRDQNVTFTLRTAGYVTNAGTEVAFLVPLAKPIVGSPTVTVSSGNGFILRQGAKYTHGSSANTFATPSSYSVAAAHAMGVVVTATFSNTTNVTNNDTIGVYWNGTITFS
jgi:uncharacterized repeat protein (TIGR02543 family)